MTILILENVPPSLRGELTRWMLEPKAGVFVGRLSALVRERLWNKACHHARQGGCLLIHHAQNEQGYSILSHGNTTRSIVDYEGLLLVKTPKKS
jgi:CRISPR-associated protein Cas2